MASHFLYWKKFVKYQICKTTTKLNEIISDHFKRNIDYLKNEGVRETWDFLVHHMVKVKGVAFCTIGYISKKLGKPKSTVERHLREFRKREMIKTKAIYDDNGSIAHNIYMLIAPSEGRGMKGGASSKNPCRSKDKPINSEGESNSFKAIKQERDIYKANQIMEYVYNRVMDAIKKGTTIKFLSRYIDQTVSNMERQAIYYANMIDMKKKRQRDQMYSVKETVSTEGLFDLFKSQMES